MNRNQIKYIAIIAMVIDHIAWKYVPTQSILGQIMHFIGRLTGPTMAYFVAEGYCHTRNIKKYVTRLGIFALISWIPFYYYEFGKLPIGFENGFHLDPYTGVGYTLFLGLLAIWLWDKAALPKWRKVLAVISICSLSVIGDWAMFNVLWCLFLYIYRDEPKKKWFAFSLVGLCCCIPMLIAKPWWSYLFMVGVFVVPFMMEFVYNGKSGSKRAVHKWFFYIFYPLHLLILGLMHYQLGL